MTEKGLSSPVVPPTLRVSFATSPEDRKLEFTQAFVIGRTPDCDVCINNEFVSRKHAEVLFDSDQWWIRDLQSSNGLFIDGHRLERAPILGTAEVRLGIRGPVVYFEVQEPPKAPAIGSETMIARYIDRYFAGADGGDTPGEHTILLRQAFHRVQKKQRRSYASAIAALAIAALAVGSYALYERQESNKEKALAQDLFYNMKSLDVDIANVEKLVLESNSQQGMEEIRKERIRRNQMERSYDQFLTTLHVYNPKITAQEKLVLRVARIFGECELTMPPAFLTEVNAYIKRWQSSGRLAKAVATAREKGYASKISQELLAEGLPPQFFYLALQESDFDPYTSGPITRKGIAKGMWQFIPETALKYGLKIGPLFDLRRPDPADERHQWEKETKAAGKYLKDLYGTDAQASGLLVIACYNWGEDRVLPIVRSMPANPKERNFWRLLSLHRDKIPQQTYDYVFYIASAAVIGEDPRLFGFDFDNPLAGLESK